MLIQHSKYLTSKTPSVKFMAALAITSATMTLAPMTANASSNMDNIRTTEHTAKFKRAMFKDPAGIQQVYSTLQKKAKKACSFGIAVNAEGEAISKEECAEDVMSQFIDSADISVLTAYHMEQEKSSG